MYKKASKTIKLVLTLILAMSLTACGSQSNNTTASSISTDSLYSESSKASNSVMGFDFGGSSDMTMESTATNSESAEEYVENSYTESEEADIIKDSKVDTESSTKVNLTEEKLVYTCGLSIETLNYDEASTALNKLVQKYNALISSENETDNDNYWYMESGAPKRKGTRTNRLQLRVPSNKYKEFVSEICTVGKLRGKQQSVDNITNKYYDTQTEIESLKIQESRLLEMYNECYSIEDMITVEKRLTEVQSQLSQLQSDLNYMDTDVAYSYVNIELIEVVEYIEEQEPVKTSTFFDRLKNTVSDTIDSTLDFLENLLFFIISIIPVLIVLVVILILFRKKIKAKVKEVKDNKEMEKELEKSLKAITDNYNTEDSKKE